MVQDAEMLDSGKAKDTKNIYFVSPQSLNTPTDTNIKDGIKIKRIHHPYNMWEDYKMGMFNNPQKEIEEYLVKKAMDLLRDQENLLKAMQLVGNTWINSAEHNLSNKGSNRQAWLGQAACCMVFGTPEHLVKQAWHNLTIEEQARANAIADLCIAEYEKRLHYAQNKTAN